MKVYDLQVPSGESFIFYQFNGKWIRPNDPEHPAPTDPMIWDPQNKFHPRTYPSCAPDRIAVPSVCKLKPEHFNDLLDEHVVPLLETIDEDMMSKNYNIFIVYKHLPDGYIEVGLFAMDGHTDVVNKKYTKKINKLLKLKVFW